jgi:hypothetical protein
MQKASISNVSNGGGSPDLCQTGGDILIFPAGMNVIPAGQSFWSRIASGRIGGAAAFGVAPLGGGAADGAVAAALVATGGVARGGSFRQLRRLAPLASNATMRVRTVRLWRSKVSS